MAQRCLVIGSETLSRVVDKHDRDSMIYSDGAGASVIEASDDEETGLLSYESSTYAMDEANYLFFGKSYNPESDPDTRYIKMHGRKIYEFALTTVPAAMKSCLDKSGIAIDDVKKFLFIKLTRKWMKQSYNDFINCMTDRFLRILCL
jgi:3-oxoacyl-[acyl-carrier-protein] synthase-3